MKISYNWLKWYVPELPEADKLSDVFMYHLAEVESVEKLADGDTLYDLNILPNRAHDLLSFMGVGREVAGQLGLKYNDPTPQYKVPASSPTKLAISVETENCRRYMGRIVRGVKVGPSPEWVVKHLASIGQRSINNIVDATNIVLFDCGQPTHAFDLSKLSDEKITIRMAADGEAMTTLDKKDVATKASDMVIADSTGVLALAGVKGGTKAEVDDSTTDIVLEVANFEPATVRKSARRLSILTDAAKRFENDLSPELASYGMRELSALILEMCPQATFEDIVDVYPNPQPQRVLEFSTAQVNALIGFDISADEIEAIFVRYGLTYDRNDESFKLSVPPLRLDLTGAHDMAEEIGRIVGYDRVVPVIPKINFIPKVNKKYSEIIACREKLLKNGYSEVMTYSLQKFGNTEVLSSTSDKKFLRSSLELSILDSLVMNAFNADLLLTNEIKIFEIGTVFDHLNEYTQLCFGISSRKGGKLDNLEKEIAESLEKVVSDDFGLLIKWPDLERKLSAPILLQNQVVGSIAVNTGISEINEQLGDALRKTKMTFPFGVVKIDIDKIKIDSIVPEPISMLVSEKFKPWSIYPFITRDVAVWVPAGTEPSELIQLCKENGTELLVREPRLFDQFTKGDKTSLAVRMVFQSHERTLTDAEIVAIMGTITEAIRVKGWEPR